MRNGTSALLLLAGLGAVACGTTTTRTYTVTSPASAPATWTGRSLDEVVEIWGPPSLRQGDGEGGTILVYQDNSGISTSVSEGGASAAVPDLDPGAPSGPQRTETLKKVRAKFWVDKLGHVYRFWFSPEVYKKGTDTPPAKKAKDEAGEPR
jgi:hypothetical protein